MNTPHTPTPPTRRELARQARDAFPPMGVYAIVETASGRARVKATRNLQAAMDRTRFELRLGSHPDKALQRLWNEGGEGAIRFQVLDRVKQRDDPAFDYAAELRALEQLHREELEAGSRP